MNDDYILQQLVDAVMGSWEAFQKLADMVDELPPINKEPAPRPPKCLRPVNKANYCYNRPPRRARSRCYIRK